MNFTDFFHTGPLVCELSSPKQVCKVVCSLQENPQEGQQVNLSISVSTDRTVLKTVLYFLLSKPVKEQALGLTSGIASHRSHAVVMHGHGTDSGAPPSGTSQY